MPEHFGHENVPEAVKFLLDQCPHLESLGITFVEVDYDGSGDEGRWSDVTPLFAEGREKVDLPSDLEDRIGDAAWSLTPDGFWNNEGGSGKVTLDVLRRSIELEHGDYVTELEYADPVTFDATTFTAE
jgi:hypothetical protein